MNNKHILAVITAVLILSSSQASSAQTETPRSWFLPVSVIQTPQGAGNVDRPDLNLTAEQKAQLKSIRQSERDQLSAVRNDQSLSREQKEAKVRSIHEAMRQQVFGILTPQQQQGIKDLPRERRGRGGQGPGRDGGPLNLTDEQRSQLKSIHQSARDQVNAIRNDATLTQEQKEAKLKSLHQSTEQQVSTMLTPEQRAKMRKGHRGGPGRFGEHGRRGDSVGPAGPNAPGPAPKALP